MYRNHFFNFDGKEISEFGCFVNETPIFPAPERRVSKIEIPGKNGHAIEDEETFSNISVTYSVSILASETYPFSIENVLHKVKQWLLTDTDFKKLRDCNHTGGFFWARCDGLNDFEFVDDKDVKFSITFDCKPFFYHDEGQEPVTIKISGESNSGRLYNIGNYFSEPIIYAYGLEEKNFINDFEIDQNGNLIIDSSKKIVTNLGKYTEYSDKVKGSYPIFKVGENTVSLKTEPYSSSAFLTIIPNWRSI